MVGCIVLELVIRGRHARFLRGAEAGAHRARTHAGSRPRRTAAGAEPGAGRTGGRHSLDSGGAPEETRGATVRGGIDTGHSGFRHCVWTGTRERVPGRSCGLKAGRLKEGASHRRYNEETHGLQRGQR